MVVEFTVYGVPQSKSRPRFVRRGNFMQTYTPKETVNYETLVKLSYQQMAGGIKLIGAIRAECKFYFPIPKSVSKKKHNEMLEGKIRPITVSKDADNCVKSVLDALNKIAYDDDRQVVELEAYKLYSEQPRAEIKLLTLDEEDFSQYMNPPEE